VEFSGSRQLALMACNGDDALANDPREVGEAALLMEHFKPADFSRRGGDQRRRPGIGGPHFARKRTEHSECVPPVAAL
jgi:hypothetical protein